MKLEQNRENVRPSGAQERQLRNRNGSWHKGKVALGKYLSMENQFCYQEAIIHMAPEEKTNKNAPYHIVFTYNYLLYNRMQMTSWMVS